VKIFDYIIHRAIVAEDKALLFFDVASRPSNSTVPISKLLCLSSTYSFA
jgi:hypothetical protein